MSVAAIVEWRLDKFERAIEAGERAHPYHILREAWRSHRAAELAVLVEQAGRRLDVREALSGETAAAFHAAWIERARANEPLDLATLIDTISEPAFDPSTVTERLDELLGRAHDPTPTTRLVALLQEPGSARIHSRVLNLLDQTGDPRVLPLLDALVERVDGQRSLVERVAKLRARVVKRFPDGVPELAPGLERRLAQLADRLEQPLPKPKLRAGDTEHEAALLAEIYRNPDDDEPRQVYADLLQARGDPRGEFIALQLAGETKHAAALLTKQRKRWLGPLAQVVVSSTVEFERGFVVACSCFVRRKILESTAFDLPEWGTVKRLKFLGPGMLSPVMTNLEEALEVPDSGLVELSRTEFPRLRVLEVIPDRTRPTRDPLANGVPVGPGLQALLDPKGLPELRELRLSLASCEWSPELHKRGPEDFSWLFDRTIGQQLERLVVTVDTSLPGASPSARWASFLASAAPPRLKSIVLPMSEGRVILARTERGVTAGMAFDLAHEEARPWMRSTLDRARATLTDAEVEWLGRISD